MNRFVISSCSSWPLHARAPLQTRHLACAASMEKESTTRGIRVGVIGLGAIGTIFFTQLSRLLLADPHKAVQSTLNSVDAFVKQNHLCKLINDPQIVLHNGVDGMPVITKIGLRHGNHGCLVNSVDYFTNRVLTLEQAGDLITDKNHRIDVVLVTLKAYDSAQVINELYRHYRHLFAKDAVFVLLQNGLGAVQHPSDDETLSWQFVHGVTFVGGRLQSLGNVVGSGLSTGKTYLAPTTAVTASPKLLTLGNALSASGFQWELLSHNQMKNMLWRKLIVNASINPIASILNATNRSVGACEWSQRCVSAIVHEAYTVAARENVEFDCSEEELIQEVLQVAQNTGNNVCSMLSDLRKGSRTEIDAITGEIVKRAKQHNIPTPVNAFVLNFIKSLEKSAIVATKH